MCGYFIDITMYFVVKYIGNKPTEKEQYIMINIPKGDLSCLNKEYTVKVDRPIGAEHPKHPGLIYPVNYGYVEGLVAGDGEEQDVYILGIDAPVESAEVVIVAVILRDDDNEDKWVGVPKELVGSEICYECNIEHAVHFQEQYHTHECVAFYEKTCGAVMYTEADGERRYLLVENADSKHIGYPKGHVEYGEDEIATAIREVREETGLTAAPMDNFRRAYDFISPDGHHKTAVYYLSHYDYSEAAIQQEELSRSWLLPFSEALKLLNYKQDIDVITAAENYLNDLK